MTFGPFENLRKSFLPAALSIVLAGCFFAGARAEDSETYRPSRLLTSSLPAPPPTAAAGGQVLLELEVDSTGRVVEVSILTDAAPFTSPLARAVRGWRFEPARDEEGTVSSQVLVAATYRDPELYGGMTAGDPSRVYAEGTLEIPYPEAWAQPSYPPDAYDDGMALLGAFLDARGQVGEVEVISSTAGFAEPSIDAVRRWQFRPAHREGRPVPSIAYLIFSYRQPLVR